MDNAERIIQRKKKEMNETETMKKQNESKNKNKQRNSYKPINRRKDFFNDNLCEVKEILSKLKLEYNLCAYCCLSLHMNSDIAFSSTNWWSRALMSGRFNI